MKTITDSAGQPTETEKAVALIEARAEAYGDNDGHTMNGRAFAQRFAGRLLFVPENNAWFEFDGAVWRPNSEGVIMQGWAAERERAALEAHMAEGSEKTKYALKHARQMLHSMHHQRAALEAASQLPNMRKSLAEFDQHPFLLAVENGVLNLRRGRMVEADARKYLMRKAPVVFDAEATCPEWLAYLEKVQPDAGVRRCLQRLVGYTLTGDVSEERFVFLNGDGSNGKSVFVGVLAALLGPFTVNIPAMHLTASRNQIDPERVHARLIGARLALSNETREGTVWNEVLLKELSSYDTASARELYKAGVDYQPTHTLWIRGNHIPGSFDSSDGLARRYTPISFNVTIPEGERDKGLLDRIKANELAGVLNWALAGVKDWALDRDIGRDGLRIPDSVRRERDAYKRDSDWFGRWLEECCAVGDVNDMEATSALFHSYRDFCAEGNMAAPSLIGFGRTMQKRGFQHVKQSGKRKACYRGITLADHRTKKFGDVE